MFTLVHVVISVLGLITGLVAVGGFMAGARRDGVTALAPTQSEAPFAVTQLLVLVLFVWLGRASLRGFSAAR